MRILFLGDSTPAIDDAPGERHHRISAQHQHDALLIRSDEEHLIKDDDLFILDPESKLGSPGRSAHQLIMERVTSGGALIYLLTSNVTFSWSGATLVPRGTPGERFAVTEGDDAFVRFVRRRSRKISFLTEFEDNAAWKITARSLTGFPIAGYRDAGAGYVFVLPHFRNISAAVREFIDLVVPAFLPSLADRPTERSAPAWLTEFPIKPVQDLERDIARLSETIAQLEAERQAKEDQRAALLRYQRLLWYGGKPLEPEVIVALTLLGINARLGPEGETDIIITRENGTEIYVEVEGTKGTVGRDKGQQLAEYINMQENAAEIDGAVIGTAYIDRHPNERKPPHTQIGTFSPQLEAMAKRYQWRLVETRQLFEWVRRYLEGDAAASEEARQALGV